MAQRLSATRNGMSMRVDSLLLNHQRRLIAPRTCIEQVRRLTTARNGMSKMRSGSKVFSHQRMLTVPRPCVEQVRKLTTASNGRPMRAGRLMGNHQTTLIAPGTHYGQVRSLTTSSIGMSSQRAGILMVNHRRTLIAPGLHCGQVRSPTTSSNGLSSYRAGRLMVNHRRTLMAPGTHYGQVRSLTTSSNRMSPQRAGSLVLGIETSCDETGAAVIDEEGNVLGEGLHSQKNVHVRNGGIIPPLAQDLHVQYIDSVVKEALHTAGVTTQDLSAVATTTMPGLALCLRIGLEYSKQLVHRTGLPFIPVHHMEAHALTIRMIHEVPFPFLVLLVSGGHCILAVARGVGDFLVLGNTTDDAPGEAFDKTARRLRLHHHPECQGLSGGQAIEKMAAKEGADITLFHHRNMGVYSGKDCQFSFAGIKQVANQFITRQEELEGISPPANPLDPALFVSNPHDIAASFQHRLTQQIVNKLQRAMEYCRQAELITQPHPALVVSGGVASNSYIRNALEIVCAHHKYKLLCPPPYLCTDNGIMIAWAGMERFKLDMGFAQDPQNVSFEPRFPLGEDISSKVAEAKIKIDRTLRFWKTQRSSNREANTSL